jgi:hypothetical protein
MKRTSILEIVSLAAILGIAACGDSSGNAAPAVAQFDATGVSPATMSFEAFGEVQILNADTKAHEIYSYDCQELASGLLQPGAEVSIGLGAGPKTCHFQDLLSPSASQYWGTVEVAAPAPPLDPSDGG